MLVLNILMIGFALTGGIITANVGSGSDILLYAFGIYVRPKVGCRAEGSKRELPDGPDELFSCSRLLSGDFPAKRLAPKPC